MPWQTLLTRHERLPANPDLAEGFVSLLQTLGAVNVIVVHVQTQFRAFQLGIELAAEHVEAQGLGFLQGLGAHQAFGLQAAFVAGVADSGDLSHGDSPCGLLTRLGLQRIDFLYPALLCKVRLCSAGVIAMNLW